jgi:hypothetical protein
MAALVLLSLAGATLSASLTAQSEEKITCPAGDTYRDIHDVRYQGREEYCELDLPGGLVVKDGPYRSWLDEDGAPTSGNYRLGRQVAKWIDCNRFNRCSSITYEAPFAEERKRAAFRPEIPVRYVQGRYRFDFGSCRSTWVTHEGGPESVSLNIGGGSPYRCVISWLPQQVMDHGGAGSYTCFIPYAVGTRTFASLDLIKEFPRAGLPQFCKSQSTSPEPLMIRSGADEVAYSTDVLCASFRPDLGGSVLALQLNPIIADLVSQTAAARGPLNTLLCFQSIEGPKIVHDIDGTVVLALQLSTEISKALAQKRCIRRNLPLKAGCGPSRTTGPKP